MRSIIYILISALVFFYGCSSGKQMRDDASDNIDISIEQGGNNISIVGDTAEIRRTKFTIRFRFSQPDGVLINASFYPETFNNAHEGLPLDELTGFKNTAIAEELFNKEGALYMSYDSPNFWYYADDSDHRFNSVLKYENEIICTREISAIVNLDSDGEKTDITKIRENEIYLVIIKSEWNQDFTRMIEKNRKLLKLKFII